MFFSELLLLERSCLANSFPHDHLWVDFTLGHHLLLFLLFLLRSLLVGHLTPILPGSLIWLHYTLLVAIHWNGGSLGHHVDFVAALVDRNCKRDLFLHYGLPILRLLHNCLRHNLHRLLHDFDWARNNHAFSKFVPSFMLNEAFQSVSHIDKLTGYWSRERVE